MGSHAFASDQKAVPTLSEADIISMIEKAEPLIEEVTGRKFKKRMKHEIVERAKLYDTLRKSGSSLYKKNLKNFDGETITRQVETEASISSQNILGLYLLREKALFVTPSNIVSEMESFQVKSEYYHDFVFLVVVHEMVHTLDDQYFNLAKLYRATKNTEEYKAINSLIEGNAVYVSEIIADRLNIPESTRTFSKKITSEMSEAQKINSQLYLKGYEFVEALINKNGKSAVEAAFKNPPVSTVQILNHEEYLNPVKKVNVDYVKLLENVTKDITPEPMKTQTMALGAMDLNKSLISNGITKDEAGIITKDCLTGSGYQAVKQVAKPRSISIEIYNFRKNDSASKLKEANLKIQESIVKQAKASLNTRLNIIKEEVIKLDGYDHVLLRESEMKKAKAITKSTEVTGLMGCNYISLRYENMEGVTRGDAMKILNLIYSEYMKLN
ncbi:MAG: hypothetical protein JW927_09840 [Deltaproteobacteria bacterium]|nr:hypothetical protein [Deltaproteobacteria bacterium]